MATETTFRSYFRSLTMRELVRFIPKNSDELYDHVDNDKRDCEYDSHIERSRSSSALFRESQGSISWRLIGPAH